MDNRNSIKKVCPACGMDFLVPKCREETAKFCSAKCKYASREKPKYITKRCKQCGKDFDTKPSFNNDYCSELCYHNSKRNRIKKICPVCNKEFEVKKSYAHVECCSVECGYKYKRTKTKCLYGSSDWKEKRKDILQIDGYVCKFCGGSKDLIVHHRILVRKGGGINNGNLVTLCRSCHTKLHHMVKYE